MTRTRRRHGRWFDALASVLIGLVVTGAALIPAATANSGGTTTIRGDVTVDGRRVAFLPVGFWAPGESLATGSTDVNGVFTLEVPVARDGWVWAGAEPDAEQAVVQADGRSIVRGSIGAKAKTPIASPLYQGWDAATAGRLAGGAAQIRFRLEEAGRIGGALPVRSSLVRAVQVRRLDGSVVESPRPDARGRWISGELAPGRYAVALVPVAPLLPTSVEVEVKAATTVTAKLPTPVTGGTVAGSIRIEGGGVGAGVPVLLEQDDEVVASTSTDSAGAYRFTGLTAGDYVIDAGHYAATRVATPAPSAVEVPGLTPTPSATSTPGPTESPSPSPTEAVLEPERRTADAIEPVETPVTVPDTLGAVTVDSTTTAAGRLAGKVEGAGTDPVQVVVEDAGSGQVLRVATAASDGSWSAGGLVPGDRYTVWAVTRPSDPTQARMGTTDGVATTSTEGVDVTIDRSAAVLQGTASGAAGGSVVVGDSTLLQRSSAVDASGAYAVQGLVPGLYAAVVKAEGRVDADPVAVTVTEGGGPQDLAAGAKPATYRGWFISGGDGVPLVSGTATSADGALLRLSSRGEDGHLEVTGLRPGTYAYDGDSFGGTVPATDGPWWFAAPQGTFQLTDGGVTNVGPVVLHVRAG